MQQVAFLVGFNDPFYFSKAFKKRTGATPKKYAKNPKIDGGGADVSAEKRKASKGEN